MDASIFDEKLQDEKQLNELIEILNKEIENDRQNMEIRHQLALVYTKLNDFSKAVNIYIDILKINPEDDLAKTKKDFIMTILSQGRLDIYACTNTHIDPWQ